MGYSGEMWILGDILDGDCKILSVIERACFDYYLSTSISFYFLDIIDVIGEFRDPSTPEYT